MAHRPQVGPEGGRGPGGIVSERQAEDQRSGHHAGGEQVSGQQAGRDAENVMPETSRHLLTLGGSWALGWEGRAGRSYRPADHPTTPGPPATLRRGRGGTT